jgi:hypothetical protein
MLFLSTDIELMDRMINEYEAAGGMRIGRGKVLGQNLPLCAPQIQ